MYPFFLCLLMTLMTPFNPPLGNTCQSYIDVANRLRISFLQSEAREHALNNDFDAALADINMAFEVYSDTLPQGEQPDLAFLASLYVQRGQVYLLLYEWDKVLDDYNTALELDPMYADAYYYRGVLYYSVRFEREKAIPDFERYLELAPGGALAEKAAQYLTDIQTELEALEK
jgi:tetratricopeptide (TPR) repeat protein